VEVQCSNVSADALTETAVSISTHYSDVTENIKLWIERILVSVAPTEQYNPVFICYGYCNYVRTRKLSLNGVLKLLVV